MKSHDGARFFAAEALVALKLACDTAVLITLEGRQRLVRHILDAPEAGRVREGAVSVDLRSMKQMFGVAWRSSQRLERRLALTRNSEVGVGVSPNLWTVMGLRTPVAHEHSFLS